MPRSGEAVFWAAGCASCHMAPEATGDAELVLTGGQQLRHRLWHLHRPQHLARPDGTASAAGRWRNFANAVTRGVSPEGEHLLPRPALCLLHQDAAAGCGRSEGLHGHACPPSATPSLPHEVGFPFNIRRSLGVWKLLFVTDDWVVTGDLTAERDPRPLYRRGAGALRRMPHAAQRAGRIATRLAGRGAEPRRQGQDPQHHARPS